MGGTASTIRTDRPGHRTMNAFDQPAKSIWARAPDLSFLLFRLNRYGFVDLRLPGTASVNFEGR